MCNGKVMLCRAACEKFLFSCGAARITSYHHKCVVLGNHVKIVSVPTLANECVRLSAQRLRHHHAAFTPAGTAPYTAAGSNFATVVFAFPPTPVPAPPDFRRRRLVVGVAPPIGDVVVAPKSPSSRPPCGIPNASKHTSSAASSAVRCQLCSRVRCVCRCGACVNLRRQPVCCHRRCTSGACASSYAPLLLLLLRGLATPRVGWFHAASTGASVSTAAAASSAVGWMTLCVAGRVLHHKRRIDAR